MTNLAFYSYNLINTDPGECDENGMTALHHACQFQKTGDDVRTKEVIMFLLEKYIV